MNRQDRSFYKTEKNPRCAGKNEIKNYGGFKHSRVIEAVPVALRNKCPLWQLLGNCNSIAN